MITSIHKPFLSFFFPSYARTSVYTSSDSFRLPLTRSPLRNLRMTLSPAEPPLYHRNGEYASTRYVYVDREAQWRERESNVVEFTKIKKVETAIPSSRTITRKTISSSAAPPPLSLCLAVRRVQQSSTKDRRGKQQYSNTKTNTQHHHIISLDTSKAQTATKELL